MESAAFTSKRVILARLGTGDDLLASLDALVRRHELKTGLVQVIGALRRAALGYYDQDRKAYETVTFDQHMEILSGPGNISLKDGKPFCHVHLALSDRQGRAFGGHLLPGCEVFAAEALLTELDGQPPERMPDDITGLSLWRFGGQGQPRR